MTDRSTRWTESLAHALAPADDTPRDIVGSILLNLAVLVAYSIAGLVVLVFGIIAQPVRSTASPDLDGRFVPITVINLILLRFQRMRNREGGGGGKKRDG